MYLCQSQTVDKPIHLSLFTVFFATSNRRSSLFSFEMDISEKFVDFRYGGRFSRAWLQSPRRYAPAGLSDHAIPAEVAACAPIN